MYTHDGGGGGGSYYTLQTHRELNAYVASASTVDLDRLRRNWDDSGRNAHEMAELIEAKLAKLTSSDGWTGAGAEAFAKTVRAELVTNLRDYARRAGGYTQEGEQNVSHAHDVELIKEAVSGSYSAASNHNIPWDVDTTWDVKQKHVDQGILSHIEEAVTGEDEDYEKAKKNAPYEILNGAKAVLKEVPKPQYEPIESSVPANPSSMVFEATNTQVDPKVKRFDLILERLGMGESPKQHVYTAVNDVHKVLSDYAPQEVKTADTTDKGNGTGPGANNGPLPGGAGGGGGGGSATPGGDGGGDGNHGDPGGNDGGDGNHGDPGGNGGGDGNYGDPGGNGGGDGGYDDGNYGDPGGNGGGDGNQGTPGGPGGPGGYPGGPDYDGPLTGGTGGGDTGAAGAGPAAPPVGGIGGPAPVAAAPGAVSVGAGAPGAGGLGSLGGGMNAGAPGTSFSLGADGRPTLNTGKVGALAGGGDSPTGARAGAGGAGGGSGAHGAGGAGGSGGTGMRGAGGRRQNGSDDEEQEQDLDETWLEEDQSVWGNRAAAPPSEIR